MIRLVSSLADTISVIQDEYKRNNLKIFLSSICKTDDGIKLHN